MVVLFKPVIIINENPVVVIDQTAAKAIKKEEPEALIGQSIKIGGHLFEVVGIMRTAMAVPLSPPLRITLLQRCQKMSMSIILTLKIAV